MLKFQAEITDMLVFDRNYWSSRRVPDSPCPLWTDRQTDRNDKKDKIPATSLAGGK